MKKQHRKIKNKKKGLKTIKQAIKQTKNTRVAPVYFLFREDKMKFILFVFSSNPCKKWICPEPVQKEVRLSAFRSRNTPSFPEPSGAGKKKILLFSFSSILCIEADGRRTAQTAVRLFPRRSPSKSSFPEPFGAGQNLPRRRFFLWISYCFIFFLKTTIL